MNAADTLQALFAERRELHRRAVHNDTRSTPRVLRQIGDLDRKIDALRAAGVAAPRPDPKGIR
jgi:hypothetical protein